MIESARIINKRKKCTVCFTVITTVFAITSYAQKIYHIEGSYLFGYNINKTSDREFGQTSPIGLELNLQRYRNGSKYWEKVYNYPHTGWALKWLDHRNGNLGGSFCLNRYINFVLLRNKYFEMYLKMSQGIMYANQIYQAGEKSKESYNNAIGQRLNFSTEISLGCNIYPFKHFGITSGSTLTHFSNGAMSQPNDGLNLLMLKIGLIYIVGDKNSFQNNQPEKPAYDKKIRFNINLAGGAKQVNSERGGRYPLLTVSMNIDKRISRINSINFGSDVFINTAEKYQIENNAKYRGTDFKRIGITLGHELLIGSTGILTQLGYHVYSPYPAISRFYQKYGLKYYITNKVYASFSVRIFDMEVSDETTFGVGVRL